ncbi:hypothetical protein IAT38_000442 [Cryptococcus sp. DSM 104549]
MHEQYPSDKSLSNVFDALRSPSPPIPSSPAPAYTALPHRDVDFHLAPVLNGQVGDVELETVDGKRFLVHRRLLEAETVFFHIYYGFVPVWRLNGSSSSSGYNTHGSPPPAIQPPMLHGQSPAQAQPIQLPPSPSASPARPVSSPLNNLLCLPKLLASHLARSPAAASLLATHANGTNQAAQTAGAGAVPCTPPPAIDDLPPPPPPKDITAPTPTTSPYTWAVPETSIVLTAFLALIYPPGVIAPHPTSLLTSLELTGRVVRAALGYQSAKALSYARDRLGSWTEDQPVQVYAMASFFKFTDLARLASMRAVECPQAEWPEDAKLLMGRTAAGKLLTLQSGRLSALREILAKPMERDEHAGGCVRYGMAEQVWERMTRDLAGRVGAGSGLEELLEVDLRGGHCGECLVLLGRSIQRCLYEAKDLPKSI